MGSLPLPLPPIEEQRNIAAFLGRETAKVDALIEKKRLLIERLEEQRTALISRTVTRGLPPEAARAAGLDPNLPTSSRLASVVALSLRAGRGLKLRHPLAAGCARGVSRSAFALGED